LGCDDCPAKQVINFALLSVLPSSFAEKENHCDEIQLHHLDSLKAVKRQTEDVPCDSEDPLFELGFGLEY
jgi:hypothetical protein